MATASSGVSLSCLSISRSTSCLRSSKLRKYCSLSSMSRSSVSSSSPVISFRYRAINGIVFPSSRSAAAAFTLEIASPVSFATCLHSCSNSCAPSVASTFSTFDCCSMSVTFSSIPSACICLFSRSFILSKSWRFPKDETKKHRRPRSRTMCADRCPCTRLCTLKFNQAQTDLQRLVYPLHRLFVQVGNFVREPLFVDRTNLLQQNDRIPFQPVGFRIHFHV